MKKVYYQPILYYTQIALHTGIMSGAGQFGDANEQVNGDSGWHNVPARHLYI